MQTEREMQLHKELELLEVAGDRIEEQNVSLISSKTISYGRTDAVRN